MQLNVCSQCGYNHLVIILRAPQQASMEDRGWDLSVLTLANRPYRRPLLLQSAHIPDTPHWKRSPTSTESWRLVWWQYRTEKLMWLSIISEQSGVWKHTVIIWTLARWRKGTRRQGTACWVDGRTVWILKEALEEELVATRSTCRCRYKGGVGVWCGPRNRGGTDLCAAFSTGRQIHNDFIHAKRPRAPRNSCLYCKISYDFSSGKVNSHAKEFAWYLLSVTWDILPGGKLGALIDNGWSQIMVVILYLSCKNLMILKNTCAASGRPNLFL